MTPAAPSLLARIRVARDRRARQPEERNGDTERPAGRSSSSRFSEIGLGGLAITANRDADGSTSFSSSTYFWLSPERDRQASHVATRLARLRTNPWLTGSTTTS